MATTYKKNAQNVYKPPLYAQFWTWWALVLTLAVLSLVVGLVVSIKIVQVVLWSLVAILTIWRAYTLTGSVIKAGTIRQYITQKGAERAITKSLLATMSVNQLRDTPYISVPRVTVGASLPSCVKVKMEKLPGMYDIDKLTEDINASFRGKLSAYAVVSSRITDDGLYYKFVLEDKGSDKTWRPKSLEEMKQNSHEIKLQNDLIINLADKPHIIAWGKSGSGKSSLLFSMILQLLMSGSEVYFIDPKSEFSAFQEFYPMERIQEDTEAILKLLRHVCGELTRRQKIVAKAVKKQQKIGLRGYDIGLIPIVVVADEIGSAVASMDNKQKKEFFGSAYSNRPKRAVCIRVLYRRDTKPEN